MLARGMVLLCMVAVLSGCFSSTGSHNPIAADGSHSLPDLNSLPTTPTSPPQDNVSHTIENATLNQTVAGNQTSPENLTVVESPSPGNETGADANTTEPTMPVPSLTVGATWSYGTTAPNYSATATVEVHQITTYSDEPAYMLRSVTVLPGSGVSMTTETFSWDRMNDLAHLTSHSTTRVETPYGDHESESSTTYAPPCIVVEWPLRIGDTWQSTCSSTTTKNGSTTSQSSVTDSTVHGIEVVAVPAGTFEAFHVETVAGSGIRHDYYAAEACGLVKSVVPSNDGDLVKALQSYECTP